MMKTYNFVVAILVIFYCFTSPFYQINGDVMELRNDEMLHEISPDIDKVMKNNQRRKNAYIILQLSLCLLMACNIFRNVDIDMFSNEKISWWRHQMEIFSA